MICPHCAKSLQRKERGDRTCPHCHQRFALEPKENALVLHDRRVQALAAKLSENTYAYTTTQLWYAVIRKRMPGRANPFRLSGAGNLVKLLVGLGVLFMFAGNVRTPALTGLGLTMIIGGLLLAVREARRRRGRVPMSKVDFERIVLEPWVRVYQADPPHLVREKRPGDLVGPADPVLVVLSPDVSVLTCLAANDVATRLHVALATTIAQVPADVPVALLHDASAAGYLFAARARAELAPRPVLDIGPRPAAAMSAKGALRRRDTLPETAVMQQLRDAGGLTDAELEWLAQGWWSPVAALRPSILIARVEAAIRRIPTADPDHDPDYRAAASVGFLTWPNEG
jgi:hypothetical protein